MPSSSMLRATTRDDNRFEHDQGEPAAPVPPVAVGELRGRREARKHAALVRGALGDCPEGRLRKAAGTQRRRAQHALTNAH